MLYHLLAGKSGLLSNLLTYISFRAAAAMVTALGIAFLLGPVIIRKLHALKVGQVIRAEGRPATRPSAARRRWAASSSSWRR
jgi:phospho-N-acetylmuramoyl-pentapeptide-transferase